MTALALAISLAASNAALERAQAELDNLRYDEAAAALDEALRVNGNDRETMIAIYELMGVVDAYLNRADASDAAFRALCALDPKHLLTRKLAPRITTRFFEAKSWVAENGGLSLQRQPAQLDGEGVAALNVTVADALGLGVAVHFSWMADGVAGATTQPVSGTRSSAPVHARRIVWRAVLLGPNDAELVTLGDSAGPLVDQAPLAVAPVPPPPPVLNRPAPPIPGVTLEPPPEKPTRRWWIGYSCAFGVSAAATLLGAVFGSRSADAYAQYDAAVANTNANGLSQLSRGSALQMANTAKTDAVVANTLFGLAGGAALLALVLVFIHVLGTDR